MLVSNTAGSQMQSLFDDIILKMSLSFFLLVTIAGEKREKREGEKGKNKKKA